MIQYFSTSCLSNQYNFLQILSIYKKYGIKNVELGICLDYGLNIQNLIRKYNFNYIVHHLFPPPKEQFIVNLASENIKILRKSISQIKKSIDFCSRFNIDFFSFHGGFRGDPNINLKFNLNKITNYEKSYEIFKSSILQILDYAEKRDINLAIENNVLAENNLIDGKNKVLLFCELWEFEKFFREIKSRNLGILLDLGHLKVTSNSLNFDANKFISKLKNKIFGIHIHENNGRVDQHSIVKEGDWSVNIINSYFKNIDIPIVFECK